MRLRSWSCEISSLRLALERGHGLHAVIPDQAADGVDHRIVILRIHLQVGEHLLPYPFLCPAAEALMDIDAIAFRQVVPMGSAA